MLLTQEPSLRFSLFVHVGGTAKSIYALHWEKLVREINAFSQDNTEDQRKAQD